MMMGQVASCWVFRWTCTTSNSNTHLNADALSHYELADLLDLIFNVRPLEIMASARREFALDHEAASIDFTRGGSPGAAKGTIFSSIIGVEERLYSLTKDLAADGLA